ncbi:heat shock protein 67B1 [Betta splendens]|uniref:Heat shock protein 67B1 n=1 Tax=Betta splendens TaxID=158456 RepID=A0A6P7NGN2_BETSP|nr:heat shock protein 67B1 [Betta splendens]
MAEAHAELCGDPLRRRRQPGPVLRQDPDRLQNRTPAPLFVPFITGPAPRPIQKMSQEQHMWRVDLDVAHFSSADISVSVRRGFLEVEGKHGERPDEHGSTARCFTRKFRLPSELDVARMTSTLSVDGILTVEAPVPEASVPAAVIIPIKVEIETEDSPETDPDSSGAPEAQRLLGTLEPEDYGKDSPLEEPGDRAPPGSSSAEPQPRDGSREQEETRGKPAAESHPSASADGGDTQRCQGSSEHREATQSQESPDALTPEEPAPERMSGESQKSRREEPEPGQSQAGQVQSREPEVPLTQRAE